MNIRDLLVLNKQDDKHYLPPVTPVITGNTVSLYFKSQQNAIHLSGIKNCQQSDTDKFLVSMGAVVIFQHSNGKLTIPLIRRDKLAPSDPLKLTMPAGRLDTTMSEGCLAELVEEMIFVGHNEYYAIQGIGDKLTAVLKNQIKKIGLNNYPVREIQSEELQQKMSLKMYLDDQLIDDCSNLFLFIDEQNKTLEFRKVFLLPEIKNLCYIKDGDGYDRKISIFNLDELKLRDDLTNTLEEFVKQFKL